MYLSNISARSMKNVFESNIVFVIIILYLKLSYAIGIPQPLAVYLTSYGTSLLSNDELLAVVKENFDLRPGIIVR